MSKIFRSRNSYPTCKKCNLSFIPDLKYQKKCNNCTIRELIELREKVTYKPMEQFKPAF